MPPGVLPKNPVRHEQKVLTSMRNAMRLRGVEPLPDWVTQQDRLCIDLLTSSPDRFMDKLERMEREDRRQKRLAARAKSGRPFGSAEPDPGADLARDLIAEFFAKMEQEGYARPKP